MKYENLSCSVHQFVIHKQNQPMELDTVIYLKEYLMNICTFDLTVEER